jgi:endoglucanase
MEEALMNRREFLITAGALAAGFGATDAAWPATQGVKRVDASRLPRWRGFNLLEKFMAHQAGPFKESDFAILREWGFDFVRLPMSYHCWAEPDDWLTLKEQPLKEIDQAVEFGKQYGVHVNLNFHRAPGYTVAQPPERLDLWTDEKALEACAFHWAHFAKRYKAIPSSRVSFDLLNEPGNVPEVAYVRVVERLVKAIRAEDPNRLIIADGLRWGRDPVQGLAGLGIGQSTRGYDPMPVSHYKASWVGGSDEWPTPTWPLKIKENDVWDKERLQKDRIEPWKELERKGVGVHVGEWGAFSHTPHEAVLDWMKDQLSLWKEAGWGWAMWNLRGGFGPLDSERADVKYENFRGHKLDREMLEIIKTG